MASARIKYLLTLFEKGGSHNLLQQHLPSSVPLTSGYRLCPLFIQTRNKMKQRTRFKAPHESTKQSERWSKTQSNRAVEVEKKVSPHLVSKEFMSRVPVDDVWIRAHYPRPQFSFEECVIRHQEYAHPSMLDNMEGMVYADMQLNLKMKKKARSTSAFKGTVLLPHPFEVSHNKRIMIFCKKEQDLQLAKTLGPSYAGGDELIKEVLDGAIDRHDFDLVLCTSDTITDLIPIRQILKDKFPNKSTGNVGADLQQLWDLFTKGVDYNTQKESDVVGKLQLPLGQLNMTVDQITENFMTFIHHLHIGRPLNLDPLITEAFIVAPPSTERFQLKVHDYLPGSKSKSKKAEEAEEEDSDSEDEA